MQTPCRQCSAKCSRPSIARRASTCLFLASNASPSMSAPRTPSPSSRPANVASTVASSSRKAWSPRSERVAADRNPPPRPKLGVRRPLIVVPPTDRILLRRDVARINIVHSTEYSYRSAVGLTRHRLMLRPDDSHDLRLHPAAPAGEPKRPLVHWPHDPFDNSICFLEWPESLRTKRLSIVSTLDLTHHPDGPPLPVYSLDPAAAAFPFSYAAEETP